MFSNWIEIWMLRYSLTRVWNLFTTASAAAAVIVLFFCLLTAVTFMVKPCTNRRVQEVNETVFMWCAVMQISFLNAVGQCTKFTHFIFLVKLPLDSFFVLDSCIFNYLSFELVWILFMNVDGVWHIDVFHCSFFLFLDPLVNVDIIYARKIQWHFNIFRLEFQLKLQSKWESRKFPRQSAFFSAKTCRMHISFHSTSFLLLFWNWFFCCSKVYVQIFLNQTVSSSYFLVTSNIHRCCFFPSSPNISAFTFFFQTSLLIFFINYDKTNSSIFLVSNNQKYLLFNRFIKSSSIVKWKSLQNMNEKKNIVIYAYNLSSLLQWNLVMIDFESIVRL